jgi:hypothetical protein
LSGVAGFVLSYCCPQNFTNVPLHRQAEPNV